MKLIVEMEVPDDMNSVDIGAMLYTIKLKQEPLIKNIRLAEVIR